MSYTPLKLSTLYFRLNRMKRSFSNFLGFFDARNRHLRGAGRGIRTQEAWAGQNSYVLNW